MKLGQYVCLNKILDKFENGSSRIKTYVTRSNLRKTCVHFSGHIFSLVLMKLGQNVYLNKISNEFENESC